MHDERNWRIGGRGVNSKESKRFSPKREEERGSRLPNLLY